jgi:amino acid transporter
MTGQMIQSLAILGNQLYKALPWQGTLIIWSTLSLSLIVNLIGGKLLPRIEVVVLVLHILGFFAIMITLVYMAEPNTAKEVFTTFQNGGGFSTQGLSWFVGMTGSAFGFAGGDGVVHVGLLLFPSLFPWYYLRFIFTKNISFNNPNQMAEEIAKPERVIPRALMLSVAINGCLGFGMIVAMLFCAGPDLGGKLGEITGYNFMGIFMEATNSLSGTIAMCSIVIIFYGCAVMGLLAAASRQLWSFSRDRGVPGWRWWKQVRFYSFALRERKGRRERKKSADQHTIKQVSTTRHLPVNAILLSVTISTLLGLINLGSTLAMYDVVSLAVSGIYLSYLVVAILLLIRRVQGYIYQSSDSEDELVNVPGAKLVWGPFHCPGVLGIVVNALAVAYITIVVFFSFWPSLMNPTAEEMNWAILGVGATMFLTMIYFVFRARHVYTGPVVEL